MNGFCNKYLADSRSCSSLRCFAIPAVSSVCVLVALSCKQRAEKKRRQLKICCRVAFPFLQVPVCTISFFAERANEYQTSCIWHYEKRKGPSIDPHARFQPAVDIFLIITYPVRKLDYAKIIGDVVWKTIQYWVELWFSVKYRVLIVNVPKLHQRA